MKLIDNFGRVIDYLRISVTDRCNLRCVYCMPKEGVENIPYNEILRYEEILEIVDVAISLGIKKIRITGGEPLVRKGLIPFLCELSQRKVDFSITTNGILLGDFAKDLKKVRVKRINVSLDTLSEKKFFQITRGGNIKKVINGILRAKEVGIEPIKINTVVLTDANEQEIKNFVEFAKTNGLVLRFIEHIPFVNNQKTNFAQFEQMFKSKYKPSAVNIEGFGPGRHYRINGAIIGFISSISRPFCKKCNRLRLTANGKLLPCLGYPTEIDLKKAIRRVGKKKSKEIKNLFLDAVSKKPEKHLFNQPKDCMNIKSMISIGG
ncbi:MAG: GTP 3',8-cyclase MoaA [Elusimicrobiota bacterium]